MDRGKGIGVIVGPTAVGKTAIAVEAAERLGTEIVNADSRQVYRLMDIGSAKPTQEERARVEHHMVDLVYPDEGFSAADFAARARKIIDDLLRSGKIPLVVGGSGLYIKGIIEGFFQDEGADWEQRAHLLSLAERHGRAHLHRMLEEADPEAASRVHPNDLRRVVRALEVYHRSGRPISYWRRKTGGGRPYQPVIIGLTMDRAELYRRIDARVERMVEGGFLDEVRELRRLGYDRDLVSMSGLGYKHLLDNLDGKLALDEAIKLIKRDTRRYAKRQLTWFRGMEGIHWINLDSRGRVGEVAEEIAGIIQRRISEIRHREEGKEVRPR